MSKQTGAAIGAIASHVNWERKDLDLQAIIEAGNQGKLGQPLTDWLVAKSWEKTGADSILPTPELLLELVGTVRQAATTAKFVAKEKIKLKRDGGICSYIGDNFRAWFLSGAGRIEDPISEQTLRYHKLRQSSVDGQIITELGGEAKAETTLTEMFSLMEKQKNGEDGVLLNNGWVNIFYIKDQNGVLRTGYVGWCGDGWDVDAGSVEDLSTWRGGDQVFSRNSVLKSSETLVPA